MRRIVPLAAGLLAAVALAGSTAPAGADFAQQLVTTPAYLVCAGTTKLAQANAAVDGTTTVGWDNIPPAHSFQTGAGCASAETFAVGSSQPDAVLDLPLAGTFTGNLTAMAIKLYAVDTTARAVDYHSLLVDVTIDGRTLVSNAPVQVDTTRSANGATGFIEFAVTNIDLLTEGDSVATHTVEVRVSTRYPDVGTVTAWVWDASEFPSGITFNPVRLPLVRVRASGS